MIDLTQAEADALLAMAKRRQDNKKYRLPPNRGSVVVPLEDMAGQEIFLLSVWRGGISLERRTLQTRARQTAILARLDFGAPHRNPDGEEVGVPHLHVYREGYGDKWAYPVPPERFTASGDIWQNLVEFLTYCNVVEPPDIERVLLP